MLYDKPLQQNLYHTSNQERLPAGLKHLIKPRKRN